MMKMVIYDSLWQKNFMTCFMERFGEVCMVIFVMFIVIVHGNPMSNNYEHCENYVIMFAFLKTHLGIQISNVVSLEIDVLKSIS